MTTTPAAIPPAGPGAERRPATSDSARRPRRRFGRAATVTAAAAFNQTVTNVPGGQGSSAIFAAVEDEFGWTRDIIAGVASFGRVGGTLLGPLEGWMTDRFGAHRMLLAGMVLGGVALLLFSRISSPSAYYTSFFAMSLGFSIGGFTPAMSAVNNWVAPKRRATSMAVVFGGQSIAAFLVPVMAWGFASFGWRTTLAGVGTAIIVSAVPVYLAMKGRPASGERPPAFSMHTSADFTVRQALRTRAFWAIAVSHMLVNLSNAAVGAHLILHLRGEGLSLTQASSVLPVIGATGFIAQFAGGVIGDRMDKRMPAFGAMLLQGAAMAALPFTSSIPAALVFAAMWGIGTGVRFPLLHAMRGEYFGRRYYGTILGFSSLPLAIGMTVTPWAVGRLYVANGTYTWTFLALAAACVAGGVTVLLARAPGPPPQANRVEVALP